MTQHHVDKSPPSAKHLAWALPVALLVAGIVWWFEAGLWTWGDEFRQPRSYILGGYWTALPIYVIGAAIGSISILLANWSRRLWPRILLAGLIVVLQAVTATLFMLIPRVT